MLTKLIIRNFKRLQDVEIELGQTVVFIGPNNSGKTTALQALALWDFGLRQWQARKQATNPSKKSGIVLNRKDLTSIPVPEAKLLWRNLQTTLKGKSHQIEVIVNGIDSHNEVWEFGMQFRYQNEESFYCRPIRREIPNGVDEVRVSFLPPMSGLASVEDRLERGSIFSRIGQGRTADVLRNLAYQLFDTNEEGWNSLKSSIATMFQVQLQNPIYNPSNGTLEMYYRDADKNILELSASGRGMLQIILLLSYLYTNPSSVLLLDEPDAHLEIVRQKDVYHLLTNVANTQNSQVILASHSEAIMNEAGDRDTLIAFVGKPHRIDDRAAKSQVAKALKEIGFEHYYQAEQLGWVLYLEGATDKAILQAFAQRLGHEAARHLATPYVDYVANNVSKARDRFFGLREAKPDLVGIALFDRVERQLQPDSALTEIMWRRREIENYLCQFDTLIAYAQAQGGDESAEVMRRLYLENVPRVALDNPAHPFWLNTKISDDFLNPLFEAYFSELELPNLLRKTNYHRLADFIPIDQIDPEVIEKLDAIVEVAQRATPRTD
jgi:energy-coupling factor transporter ATP-binding protein EcfA2